MGKWQLAKGNWQLATGNWQLATGNWQSEKSELASQHYLNFHSTLPL
jgi:hypothetical protein